MFHRSLLVILLSVIGTGCVFAEDPILKKLEEAKAAYEAGLE